MSLDAMVMMVAGCSETHTRSDNQDRIFPAVDALPQRLEAAGCFAVADGMGGTQDGAAAAEIAIRHLSQLTSPRQYLAQQDDAGQTFNAEQRDAMAVDGIDQLPAATRRALMGHHFEAANEAILQELGGPGQSGTTLSVLLLVPDAICMGHLGDSRIYLWRQGQLHQLTDDHNVYAARRQSGYIPFFPHQLQLAVDDRIYLREHKLEDVEFYYKLGQQEAISPLPQAALIHVGQQVAGRFAELHTIGKVTSVQKDKDRLAMALGKQAELPPELLHPQPPEGIEPAPLPGDLFLLCTDGLCGILTHEQLAQRLQQIAQLFGQEPSLDLLHWGSQQLLDDAIQAGSSDNISLLLVAIEGQPSPPQEKDNSQEALQQLSQQQLPEAGPHQMPHSVGRDGSQGIDVLTDVIQPRIVPTSPQPEEATATDFASEDIVLPRGAHGRPSDGVNPTQRKRYQLVIGALVALLVLATWGWLNAPSSDDPTPAPRPSDAGRASPRLSGTGGQALFWMPMPDMADAPDHRARLRWLQMLMADTARLQHRWGLSETQLKPLHQALQSPRLSYRGVMALWRKVPREPQDLTPFDAALLRATGKLWELIAPTYLKYLDEMKGSLALPKGHTTATCNAKKQQKRLRHQRRQLLRRWSQEAAALFANDWRLPLLRERLLLHPRRGMAQGTRAPDTAQRLKRCIKALKTAHQRLQRHEPGHRLLGPLHNRIQLHQAHIKQLRATP